MKKYSILYTLFLGLVFASCQTVSVITIEVKRPAEISIPENVQKVVVVNNIEDQPDDYGHKVLSSNGTIRKDSNPKFKTAGLGDLFTNELVARLNSIHWFTVYKQKLSVPSYKTFLEELPLSKSQSQELKDSTQSDLIISLDRLIIESEIKLNFLDDQNLFRVTMDGRSYPTIGLYTAKEGKVLYTIRQQDSLYWQNYGLTSEQAVSGFPAPQNCFQDLVMYGVDRIMKKLIPYSEQVNRWYYSSGNINLHDAANYVKRNRWDDAASIWEYVYENNKRVKVKAFSAANMALYCEIIDRFDEAIEWAEKSVQHFNQMKSDSARDEAEGILQYISELKRRKEEAGKLDKQFLHQ